MSSQPSQHYLPGQLLIAMPNMGDPRFDRSVVLMCSHDEDHAMGLIVNKRVDDVELSDLLAQLNIPAGDQANDCDVFFGGPVQTERGVVLHTLDYQLEKTLFLPGGLGLTATRDILVDIAGASPKRPAPDKFLLAVGHAGWGGGQLEDEIAQNAWLHCDADQDIIFSGAHDDTWTKALSKLGVTSAMLSAEWSKGRNPDTPLN